MSEIVATFGKRCSALGQEHTKLETGAHQAGLVAQGQATRTWVRAISRGRFLARRGSCAWRQALTPRTLGCLDSVLEDRVDLYHFFIGLYCCERQSSLCKSLIVEGGFEGCPSVLLRIFLVSV